MGAGTQAPQGADGIARFGHRDNRGGEVHTRLAGIFFCQFGAKQTPFDDQQIDRSRPQARPMLFECVSFDDVPCGVRRCEQCDQSEAEHRLRIRD